MFTGALILRHWKLALTGLALVILASTAAYYRIDRDHWRAVAKTLRIDLDNVKTATELADAKWKQQVAEREAANRAAIQGARNDERNKAMRDAAAAFAERNRVRPNAGGKAQGGNNTPGGAEQGNDGPGADADMVAVPRADFDMLTDNTIRLDTVQRQAQDMIDRGIAVPETVDKPR